jgi:OPA family glycerol-3-phosphate transporter-like MFS transporter
VSAAAPAPTAFVPHSDAFRVRRFWNWFPLGLTYAFLYMARYNLDVAKGSLGGLLDEKQFGDITGYGNWVYGLAFLLNGPLTDRFGGKFALLVSALGSAAANLAMGWYVQRALGGAHADSAALANGLTWLYCANMYFQSFAAVSIVKVNSAWFHVRERGSFSGIFGTMISAGIYFAYSGNDKILEWWKSRGAASVAAIGAAPEPTWVVFYAPALLLIAMSIVELFLLRDQPGQAGFADFDTGEGRVVDDGERVSSLGVMWRILTHPILLTIALIEFCTGVLRQGVMRWFPILAKQEWKLPSSHFLRSGSFEHAGGAVGIALALGCGVALFFAARRWSGRKRGIAISLGGLACLLPFLLGGGWGGMLFVAGVIGGNLAGWCSDLFFHSRRGPSVAFFYALCLACAIGLALLVNLEGRNQFPIGVLMFVASLSVIGTHGLLSGTATMDFGGKRATGTAVGVIDGFVYLGAGVQAKSLGYLTKSPDYGWSWWPIFLIPFALIGLLLCVRIWHAMPGAVRKGGH